MAAPINNVPSVTHSKRGLLLFRPNSVRTLNVRLRGVVTSRALEAGVTGRSYELTTAAFGLTAVGRRLNILCRELDQGS